jgi:hypothetical protein
VTDYDVEADFSTGFPDLFGDPLLGYIAAFEIGRNVDDRNVRICSAGGFLSQWLNCAHHRLLQLFKFVHRG